MAPTGFDLIRSWSFSGSDFILAGPIIGDPSGATRFNNAVFFLRIAGCRMGHPRGEEWLHFSTLPIGAPQSAQFHLVPTIGFFRHSPARVLASGWWSRAAYPEWRRKAAVVVMCKRRGK